MKHSVFKSLATSTEQTKVVQAARLSLNEENEQQFFEIPSPQQTQKVFMQDIYWKINIFFITSIVFMILAVAVDFIVVYDTLIDKKVPILSETLQSSIAFLFSLILLVYFWVFAEMITVEELAGTSTESKD